MLRGYTFLLRPTTRQAQALGEMLRDHCTLYNGALQERRDAYRHASRTTVRYGAQSAQLKEIRALDPEGQGRWSFSSQQATLRRLDKAFAAFFRRVKSGDKPVKTITVKREGRRWYVILACDEVPAEPLPLAGAVVGIDMGVSHFLTTSHGEHVANPRFLHASADALAEAQRHLSAFPRRTRHRTKKHRAAARQVADLHTRIRRQRLDHHHKVALGLVREYDVVGHERLNIAGMTKTPKPRIDPARPDGFLPNGAAAKSGLNRSILDAGWGQFLKVLANKAESAGRRVIVVDARNTSRTCPTCGHVSAENRLSQATFRCTACGFAANADHVGALNVLSRAGLALCDVA